MRLSLGGNSDFTAIAAGGKMKSNIPIQLKAMFLVIVFGFNTVVGFACAIGIDMNFNSSHHHEEAPKIHVHVNGKAQLHGKKKHSHSHQNGKDDCCNDKVLKISQADKAVPQSAKLLSPAFFTAMVSVYYHINIFYPSQVNTFTKYFVRGHHPPIADIRIAIRSFQI